MCQGKEHEIGGRCSLHRIREVRLRKGATLETVSQRMSCPVELLAAEEDPSRDLAISRLQAWSNALGVAVSDLLIEPSSIISLPGLTIERLDHMEKLAKQIIDHTRERKALVFANGLARQLKELRPRRFGIPLVENGGHHESNGCSQANPRWVNAEQRLGPFHRRNQGDAVSLN